MAGRLWTLTHLEQQKTSKAGGTATRKVRWLDWSLSRLQKNGRKQRQIRYATHLQETSNRRVRGNSSVRGKAARGRQDHTFEPSWRKAQADLHLQTHIFLYGQRDYLQPLTGKRRGCDSFFQLYQYRSYQPEYPAGLGYSAAQCAQLSHSQLPRL